MLKAARGALQEVANEADAVFLQRYFKTGPGEYGEGDRFLGVRVPIIRRLAVRFKAMTMDDILSLLRSSIHEERLLALIILINTYKKAPVSEQKRIFQIYLQETRFINNWDLVDVSAEHIVGAYLFERSRKPLYELARSQILWERRIAIISTFYFIRRHDFADTLEIASLLLDDNEDLIHKATGWMLREVGKRERGAQEVFLRANYRHMPRTMLRYAIERFPEDLRQQYLKGLIE